MESPCVESIDWAKWHVFWVDERVVPKDHADSNYKLAYDGFLSKVMENDDMRLTLNDCWGKCTKSYFLLYAAIAVMSRYKHSGYQHEGIGIARQLVYHDFLPGLISPARI